MHSALSRHIYTDWSFYKGLLAITLPIALQNLINVGVSAADVLMLGAIGDAASSEIALSAASLSMLGVRASLSPLYPTDAHRS